MKGTDAPMAGDPGPQGADVGDDVIDGREARDGDLPGSLI